MTAIELFETIEKLNVLIVHKQRLLKKIRSDAEIISINTDNTPVKSSKEGDQIGKIVSKIIDYEKELSKEILKLTEYKMSAIKIIDCLDDKNEIKVLYMKYIDRMPLSSIAREINYCEATTYAIHKRALQHIDKILLNNRVN